MVVQFCEDCGNLLKESPQDLITCVVCGKVAKSRVFHIRYLQEENNH